MILFLLIFSFFLQGILSLYLPFHHALHFLSFNFLIVTLVLIYPILQKKKKITFYYIICIVYGFFFDLVYTNTLVIDSLLFLLIGFIVKSMYLKLKDNIGSLFIVILISNYLYDLIFYLLLLLFKNVQFYPLDLFYKFLNSIILNLIYAIVLFIATSRYKKAIKISIY